MAGPIVLQERYALLRRIGENAGTIRWLAEDRTAGGQVQVAAFFSPSIMRQSGGAVSALPGKEVQYKSLSSDYEELMRYCMALPRESPLLRPTDLFSENGTVWAVYPIAEVQTLDDYLARHGTLNWGEMKRAMGPIVGLMAKLHADGVIHRGIGAETIMVDRGGNFLLTGFSIPPARTVGSEIEATLFFGYSAPEQYSSSSWQGTWTDVYSLAAVCYRLLTGKTPVEWCQRNPNHPLTPPAQLAVGIPPYGSEAIVKGLSVDLSERYRTTEEFWAALLREPGGTIPFSAPAVEKRADLPHTPITVPQMTIARRMLPWALVCVLGLSVVVLAALLVSRRISPLISAPPLQSSESVSSPGPSASSLQEESAQQLVVPNFIGSDIEEILLNSLYKQLFTFRIERDFSETKTAGTVIAQDPPGDTPYDGMIEILLHVSKGSERTTMPTVAGFSYEAAAELLRSSEIAFETRYTAEGAYPIGYVASASAPAGSVVYRTQDVVTIYVRAEGVEDAG